MARSIKKSHKIVVDETEYRWRATGNDGWISVTIWPSKDIGPVISCEFSYHETLMPNGPGAWCSQGNQIVITNRITRRVILYAISEESYSPHVKGSQLDIWNIEGKIQWEDAVRSPTNES